jgi:hypothetical protein
MASKFKNALIQNADDLEKNLKNNYNKNRDNIKMLVKANFLGQTFGDLSVLKKIGKSLDESLQKLYSNSNALLKNVESKINRKM